MGVLACERDGCTHIMCDNILDVRNKEDLRNQRSYYVCDECLAELNAIRATWSEPMTIDEFHDQIRSFMNNEKGSRIRLSDNKIEEEFERILRRR